MLNTNSNLTIFANGDLTYLSSDADNDKTYNYFDLNSKQTRALEFVWGWAQFTLNTEGKVDGIYPRKNLTFIEGKPKFESYGNDNIFGGRGREAKTTNKQELIHKK